MTFSPISDQLLEDTMADLQSRLDECGDDSRERWETILEFIDAEVGLVIATDRIDPEEEETDPIRQHAHLFGDDLDEPRPGIMSAIEAFEPADAADDEFLYDSIADPDMIGPAAELAFRQTELGAVILVGAFDTDGPQEDESFDREWAVSVTRARWNRRLTRRFGPGGYEPEALAEGEIEPIDPEDVGPFLAGLAWNLVHESASSVYPEVAWPVLCSYMDPERGIYVAVDQMDPDEDDAHVAMDHWVSGEDLDEPNELLMDFILLCADLLPDVQADLDISAEGEEFESVIQITAGPSETSLALRMGPRGPLIVGLFDTDSLPDDDEREEAIEAAYESWIEELDTAFGPG